MYFERTIALELFHMDEFHFNKFVRVIQICDKRPLEIYLIKIHVLLPR